MTYHRRAGSWAERGPAAADARARLPEEQIERLRDAYRSQPSRSGIEAQHESWVPNTVEDIHNAPFEMYYRNGTLAARGQNHVVSAKSNQIGTGSLKETLAAIGRLGIRAVEG